VNALFTSGLPFIKRSRLSLVDLLKELYKCYEVQARIIKLKRDKDFPKSTSLKVPCFQNSNNIDHSEEKALIKDIIQNANVELLNVAALTATKDILDKSKSFFRNATIQIFEYMCLPSSSSHLVFDSVHPGLLKYSRFIAFFKLYYHMTSSLAEISFPKSLSSKERIVVTKDPLVV